ncbi:sheath polysaccharide-degrading enzyme, partial [Kitasatospora phosalacinea]
VQILNNTIGPNIGGENIDLKEGTTGGLVSGNRFDGNGLTNVNYDDSWVDVKGNGYVIENNTGVRTMNDGYQTHTQQPGWGCGTVFRGNASDLTGATGTNAAKYAIDVTNYSAACPVTVTADNTVTGPAALANPGVPVG